MVIFIIGLNAAEQLYPGYSVSLNYMSDLGATCHGRNCEIVQPSAIIFDSSVFLAGISIIVTIEYAMSFVHVYSLSPSPFQALVLCALAFSLNPQDIFILWWL